jgi:hypothetical protein
MNHSRNHRHSPLAPFPGEPTPRLYDRGAEALRLRPRRFRVMPTGKGVMEVSLGTSYTAGVNNSKRGRHARRVRRASPERFCFRR